MTAIIFDTSIQYPHLKHYRAWFRKGRFRVTQA
jgi:hypothetical protein